MQRVAGKCNEYGAPDHLAAVLHDHGVLRQRALGEQAPAVDARLQPMTQGRQAQRLQLVLCTAECL
jgi:hypothetical protein